MSTWYFCRWQVAEATRLARHAPSAHTYRLLIVKEPNTRPLPCALNLFAPPLNKHRFVQQRNEIMKRFLKRVKQAAWPTELCKNLRTRFAARSRNPLAAPERFAV